MLSVLKNSGNVYSIYLKDKGASSWKPVYVGQRKKSYLRQCITEHLITKSKRTGSVLEPIKAEVTAGNSVAFSYIKVEPESMRRYVEEVILSKNKNFLLWNIHS